MPDQPVGAPALDLAVGGNHSKAPSQGRQRDESDDHAANLQGETAPEKNRVGGGGQDQKERQENSRKREDPMTDRARGIHAGAPDDKQQEQHGIKEESSEVPEISLENDPALDECGG